MEKLLIFIIFVSMSRRRPIYVLFMRSVFISIFIFTEILLLLHTFLNMYHYFQIISWMKIVNNFQMAKVQPQSVA